MQKARESRVVELELSRTVIYFIWQSRVQGRGSARERGFRMREAGLFEAHCRQIHYIKEKCGATRYVQALDANFIYIGPVTSPSPLPHSGWRKSPKPRLPPLRTTNSEQQGGGIYRSACRLAIFRPLHKAHPMAPQPCPTHALSALHTLLVAALLLLQLALKGAHGPAHRGIHAGVDQVVLRSDRAVSRRVGAGHGRVMQSCPQAPA